MEAEGELATHALGEANKALRGRGELFGGLYGVPMAPLGTDGDTEAAARFALEEAGVGARLKVPARGELVHVLSHRRLSVTVFAASHATILHSSEARWLETGGPSSSRRVSSEVGLARLTEKILALA
jgi:A/G-specific adenine glycosylase